MSVVGYGGAMRFSIPTIAVVAVAIAVTSAGPTTALPAPGQTGAVTSRAGEPAVHFSGPEHRNARLSIPALGIRRLLVVAYRGKTDDGPGTRIQNRGIAASPFGPRGG